MKKNLLVFLCMALILSTGITTVFAKTENNSLLKFNVKKISSEEESKLKQSIQEVLTKYENNPLVEDVLEANMKSIKAKNPTFYTQLLEKIMDQTITVTNVQPVMGDTLFMANVHFEGYDLSNLFALADSYINTDGEEYEKYSPTVSKRLKDEISNHNQKVTELFNKKINELEKVNYDYSIYATKNNLGYRINKKISGELFTFLGQDYRLRSI
ncbi:MAG: hypothetical protein E7G36_00040 [Peptoniphilus rhinitidis]|uniref:hypothetical protein n=1 Tax=Peptoniphilus rhinitidis TaxID=1175452 RepID=UPI0028FE5831|nr:hypothetical protein [Peptoniphilus rhinitidis]MDU2109056.1 hypothetical protein [Peptoniphilus lacydonensis]MDU3750092.1 hypothetical protein [Peptoniphilus rhinitidis]